MSSAAEDLPAVEPITGRERFLQAVFDSIADGVVVADKRGRPILFNPAASTLVGPGVTSDPVSRWSKDFGVFYPDGSTPYPRDQLPLARAIRGEASNDVEVILRNSRTPTGTHLSISGRPVRDRARKTIGGVVIFRDIADRRRMESVLKESEERYRSLFEACPDAVVLTDLSGRIVLGNHQAARLHAFRSPGELTGMNAFWLVAPEDRHRLRRALRSALPVGRISGLECTLLRRDKTRFLAEVNASIVLDGRGRPRAFTAMTRDITARKDAEARLKSAHDELELRVRERTAELSKSNRRLKQEIRLRKNVQQDLARRAEELSRSNQELEQFAYVASHDMKEPLRMVSSYLQLLEKRYRGKLDSDAEDFIGYAVDGAARMRALIDGLLAYSRAGTRPDRWEPIDCNIALQRALANLRLPIEETGALVTADTLPFVVADEVQLEQLFQNLIENAIKFRSEDPPRISIHVKRKRSSWMFTVRDNGIGIDAACSDRIFGIFQRLHGRGAHPGTGIGLALCRKIVESLGGEIWVESQPGSGSTFQFTIPHPKEARQ